MAGQGRRASTCQSCQRGLNFLRQRYDEEGTVLFSLVSVARTDSRRLNLRRLASTRTVGRLRTRHPPNEEEAFARAAVSRWFIREV